jgi:diguanylate cyclase (GGDEF)-like protein/PAS domain S-box-containing protein
VAECFLSVLAATYLVSLRTQSNLIWVANGMLLAYLLLVPRWRWLLYFAVGFAAQFTGAMLAGAHSAPINLAMVALNLAEVAIAAFCLRKRSARLPRFTNRTYLLRFLACAVVFAPAIIGVAFSLIAHLWAGLGIWPEFRDWFTTDALGMAVATPAFVAIFRTRFKGTIGEWTNLAYPAVLIILVPLLFQQTRIPAMAVIFPLLVLIQLRLGLGWASLATLLVAGAGSYVASRSGGTIQVSTPIGVETSDLRLQIFVAAAMFTLYSISVVVENLRSTERKLREIVYLHELVTENSRDVIILADLDGNRSYVSAAAKTIGGWEPDDLRKGGSYAFVHPDDVLIAQEAVRKLKEGADHCMIECRARKKSGEYAWLEASLRAVRDPKTGAPKGVLNILREITERKHAEQRLEAAYQAVERLATVDPLTGLANRRRFDDCLAAEWRRGLRERRPLSIVLIDVDLFKLYNDTYGHVRGDACLKQIAESAMEVVTRPADLVSRFGGEEFAIILPDTDPAGAISVANQVCAALQRRNLSHEASPYGLVTISAGCATLLPKPGALATDLIEHADSAMYEAKRTGRNRVCSYRAQELSIADHPMTVMAEPALAAKKEA